MSSGGTLSTGCGCFLHGPFGCVPPLDTTPLVSGDRPQGFNPLRRGWVYRPAPEAPQKGDADEAQGIFGTACRVGLQPCHWTYPKTALCHILTLVGCRINTSLFVIIRFRDRKRKPNKDEVEKFTYLESSVASTEKNIDTRLTKAWTAINRLSIIWKSDLTDKMKRSFFQAAVTSILLYGCTTWMLTKRLEKKLDGNYTRMLRAIVNKSWRQHSTKHQLYGHLPPITKTIQVRRTRHAGHCWRSRDELISDVLLCTPTHGRAKAGRPTRTYIQQLCEDTGWCPEDLPEAINDREKWRERGRDIRGTSMTWWWW